MIEIFNTACVVECVERNPYCFGYKMRYFSKNDVSLVFINFSKIFGKQGNNEIGG